MKSQRYDWLRDAAAGLCYTITGEISKDIHVYRNQWLDKAIDNAMRREKSG